MNQNEFNKKISEYGKLIEVKDDTGPYKFKLNPIEKICEFDCGKIVENQIIDYNRLTNRTQCRNCKKYLVNNSLMGYYEMIEYEKSLLPEKEIKVKEIKEPHTRGPYNKVRFDSVTGEKNISYSKKMKAYIAYIWDPFKKKKTYVGYYKLLEEAINARNLAEEKLKNTKY